MPLFDVELAPKDLQGLSSADAVIGFFAKLGYDTSSRTNQTAANLGIPEAVARPIKRIELIADHQKLLQVYLFELKSVTVAEIKGLARVFRNFAGQFLLVLTADYEFVEFVLLDREFSDQKGPTSISTAQPLLVQRRFSLDRRHPTPVHLRVLRRFTWTEADPFGQFDKLRFAYDLAHWSEVYFNNRGLFSDYYLTGRLRPKDIRIKCSQLNIFLLRIAGSSTSKTVRDSSKTRKTDNANTHHHLNIGFRPRWGVLRPYPLGSGRRGRHWAGDNIVDSPHRLHAWLVPLMYDNRQ